MTESPGADAVPMTEALHAWIEALRRDGGARVDPARFRFLEALSRRMAGQPEPVRGLLQARLHAALGDYAASVSRVSPAQVGAPLSVRRIDPKATPSASPLAQLNQSIRAARANAPADDDAGDPDELASARRFRRTWTSLRIQDQVDEAVARKPANAGPLNSHVLVLQSLDLMRALSPRYLERFLAHVETLQWLDEAGQKAAEPQDKPAKPAKPPRRKPRPS